MANEFAFQPQTGAGEERCLTDNKTLLTTQREAKGSSSLVEKIGMKMRSLKDNFFLLYSGRTRPRVTAGVPNRTKFSQIF